MAIKVTGVAFYTYKAWAIIRSKMLPFHGIWYYFVHNLPVYSVYIYIYNIIYVRFYEVQHTINGLMTVPYILNHHLRFLINKLRVNATFQGRKYRIFSEHK